MVGIHPPPSSNTTTIQPPPTSDVDPTAIVGAASRGMHPSMSSMRQSANTSIPAVAADEAMASFVAEPPRSITGPGPSHDQSQFPAAESSSAAVLRQKLAQLSLQQQRQRRIDDHTRTSQIPAHQQSALDINATDEQRDISSTSRSPPHSSSRLAASIKSHNDSLTVRDSRYSLYNLSRGRSDHVSPSRRWDRRGASATVLSGNSGSGSGGEDSEITVRPERANRQQQRSTKRSSPSPRHHAQGSVPSSTDATMSIGTTVATTPSPSLSRKSSFKRHDSGLARWTDNKPPTVGFDANSHLYEESSNEFSNAHGALYDHDQGHITSSDEEGADASRFARRRRASLERDRKRGMRMLASGGVSSFTADKEEQRRDRSTTSHSRRRRRTSSERKRALGDLDADLRLTPASEFGSAFPSTSTSTSATPTTGGDNCSERSSLLSRSSSSDTVDRVGPLTGLMPSVARRSRMPSAGENAEAFIFGLADDEQDHHRSHGTLQHGNGDRGLADAINKGAEDADVSSEGHDDMSGLADLSPSALADALARRRPRPKPSTLRDSPAKGEKIRSLPASRRPSHPETTIPGASASSVPHRPSAILGFAPVASPSSAGMASRFNTLPRRRGAQIPSKTAWLSLSPKNANQGDQSAMIDLLSGSSVGSVEDLILVDQVEWASDREDATASKDQAFQRRKAKAVDSRRSSMISVRRGEMDLLEGSGQPTVAALEAGSLLSGRGTSRDRISNTSSSPSAESALPPVSPTGSGEAIFSKTDPVAGRKGFDAVYQDRISNLQSQLRLWSRNPQHGTSSPERKGTESDSITGGASPSGVTHIESDHPNVQPAQEPHSSGLLASSWKQIARLPNLFFHAGGNHDRNEINGVSASGAPALIRSTTASSIGTNGTVTPLTRSSSASAEADVSSFADEQAGAFSALSSPDASRLNLRSSSDSEASAIFLSSNRTASSDTAASRRQTSHGRSPSLGARGVVSPQEGDVDPGAYVTGLGHRIDPDVELASVVHMHASRAHRGKSVDAGRRSSSHHGSGHPAAARQSLTPLSGGKDRAERAIASDSERSPVLNAQGGVEELLSKPQVNGAVPVLQLPHSSPDAKAAHADAPSAPIKQQLEVRSNGDVPAPETGLAPSVASTPRKARSRARFNLHNDEDEQLDKVEVAKDADPGDQQTKVASTQAPVLEAERRSVPEVDDDGFTVVRGHRGRGRPGVSRPAAEAPVPVNFSAYGDVSSSASDEDTGASPRAVRSRSRGRFIKEDVHHEGTAMTPSSSSQSSSTGRAQSTDEDEEDRTRGSARGRRGRGRVQGGRDQSPPASSRTRQCAIGLFSASSNTPRRDGSPSAHVDSKIAAATRSDLGMRTVRSSPNLSYAKVAASRVGQGNSKKSPDAERGGRGRGREGERDGDSSDDERSRRGRARGVTKVTSSSFKESECPPNSLPRSASAGDFRSLSFAPSSPEAAASQSHALQLRKQRVLASQSTGNAPSSSTSDLANAASASSSESGSSSGAVSLEQSDASSSTSGSLMSVPNRPTLLSNSAHLLMLSLELEMMRAQKISAPLRIRWARQRTLVASATTVGEATGAPPSAPSAETDPDVDATSGSDASAVVAAPNLPASPSESTNAASSQRDPAKGNPLYSSLFNAQQLYGRVYRPRQASQLRNVLNAHST